MEITIIELDYHAEVLRNLILILQETEIKFNIITRRKIWEKVNLKNDYPIFFIESYTNLNHLITKKSDIIKNVDIIFFNTIASNFRYFYQLQTNAKIIVRVHNSYTFFSPKYHFTPTFFQLWKDTSHLVRKELFELDWLFKKRFLNTVDFFSFPNQIFSQFAIHQDLIVPQKVLLPCLPLTFFNPIPKQNNNSIRISIIGTIDQRRRNYKMLLSSLYHLDNQIDFPIIITLLGEGKGVMGKIILNKFKKQNLKNIKVETFNDFVPNDKFESILSETILLLSPIHQKTKFNIYTEEYGRTKISGSINDMIKYGIPILIPDFYPTSTELNQIVFKYHETPNLLATKIKESIISIQQKDLNFNEILKNYSKNKISSDFLKSITKIVKK